MPVFLVITRWIGVRELQRTNIEGGEKKRAFKQPTLHCPPWETRAYEGRNGATFGSNQDRMEKDVRRQMPAHDARRHGSNQGKRECPEMKQRTGVTAATRALQGIMPSSRKDERRAAHLKPVGVGRTNNMKKPPSMKSHD